MPLDQQSLNEQTIETDVPCQLIASGQRWNVSIGFLIGAALMILAALCELAISVEAAGKSREFRSHCKAAAKIAANGSIDFANWGADTQRGWVSLLH